MLVQSMTNQNNWVKACVNANGRSTTLMVRDFDRMNPPEFLGSQTNEDHQKFLDEIKKIFEVIKVIGNDFVEKAPCQFEDVAHICYTQWMENRGKDAARITWDCFSETFLDMIFPNRAERRTGLGIH